jgi:sugar phosphate isomerase/epimerase
MRNDIGKRIGMTAWMPLQDLEEACTELKELGFEGMSVVFTQVGSRLIPAPVYEAHYAAVGDLIREAGLIVSTLNAIEEPPNFDPFSSESSFDHTVEQLAKHLRNALAMGAPGILIWDGRADAEEQLISAPTTLVECLGRARQKAGSATSDLQISVELHPFTFGLKHQKLEELAPLLGGVGAGFCVDFCHLGVAAGGDFLHILTPSVLDATNEIHYADTDCKTSEFHFAVGRGNLNLPALEEHFRGRSLPVSLDLFQWPAPRSGVRTSWDNFSNFVRAQIPVTNN